ncbi:MAG: HAD-IA family hydrolase [Verrucomicrobia bacterium]|jgi:putative hydrolase of the HAD superfamily|nr:HAD-IA family hydrolase [Verrucomicrobiota bacterium]
MNADGRRLFSGKQKVTWQNGFHLAGRELPRRCASAWRSYADVEPTLTSLRRRGLRLGAISNGDDHLRPLQNQLKLAERFYSIVVSCEVGASKPAPAVVEAAARQPGIPARPILHVGDSFEMDVQGACAAGLQAAQIER